MNAKYWQRGETLDYTPSTAVTNGQIVNLGTRIGVAGSDIPANVQGQIHVNGVFILDKAASEAITMGASVYYDATNDVITATASGNVPAGYAAQAAAAADATVLVNIGFPPSVSEGELAKYQKKITASGMLKGDGAGNISAAVAGTDYTAP